MRIRTKERMAFGLLLIGMFLVSLSLPIMDWGVLVEPLVAGAACLIAAVIVFYSAGGDADEW